MRFWKAKRPDPHYLGKGFIGRIGAGAALEDVRVNGGHSVNVTIDPAGQYRLTCNDCPHTESGAWPQGGRKR